MSPRNTYILDIDGTIFQHHGNSFSVLYYDARPLLPGVKKFFDECKEKDHVIILTTARDDSLIEATEKQIKNAGLWYNNIIYNCTTGKRIVINDCKEDGTFTAFSYSILRDSGLQSIIR